MDCVFCQIVAGEIPSHKVYEDENTLAFLNIYPSTEGYTLVVPKKHVDFFWAAPADTYTQVMQAAQKVAKRLYNVYQPRRVALQLEGLDVSHLHAKVFPFNTAEDFRKEEDRSKEPNHAELDRVAQKLKFE